jgi:hypothetical protein
MNMKYDSTLRSILQLLAYTDPGLINISIPEPDSSVVANKKLLPTLLHAVTIFAKLKSVAAHTYPCHDETNMWRNFQPLFEVTMKELNRERENKR